MSVREGRRAIFENIDAATLHTGVSVLAARVAEIPARYWVVAGGVAWAEVLLDDAFFWLWALLAVANLVDWLAGRWAVRATEPETFSRRRSRIGIYSKALGLVVLGLLRTVEAILPGLLSTPSTGGYIAAVVGLALFVDELDSIDHHRQRLGKKPIPMLSWAIRRLRDLSGADRREHRRPPKTPVEPTEVEG